MPRSDPPPPPPGRCRSAWGACLSHRVTGGGKTTLLNVLSGRHRGRAVGAVRVNGHVATKADRKYGRPPVRLRPPPTKVLPRATAAVPSVAWPHPGTYRLCCRMTSSLPT